MGRAGITGCAAPAFRGLSVSPRRPWTRGATLAVMHFAAQIVRIYLVPLVARAFGGVPWIAARIVPVSLQPLSMQRLRPSGTVDAHDVTLFSDTAFGPPIED
jgi:hypothetical protein